ncbi:MAG: endonuclease/exonuclease/phosphatase family protein [Rhodanobacteraceae bacterium]|nr:endonuclease/exonuclease/phosphatase family protein [Rhodanobacteraceae bacterium]
MTDARDHERHLRLLSFNIQAGAQTNAYREYFTRGWQTLLPHRGKRANLDQVASLARGFDVVALQEPDSHSLRSGFKHQVQMLAENADFPYWSHQRNRALALAEPGNGLLTRFAPSSIIDHRLPGRIPGRGTLEVRFGEEAAALRVFIVHLALTPGARLRQAEFIAELVGDSMHAVVLGDFNCEPDSRSLSPLFMHTRLRPAANAPSFPSWQPLRSIDQVLTTTAIDVSRYEVLPLRVSDHLPIAVDLHLPDTCVLPRTEHRRP